LVSIGRTDEKPYEINLAVSGKVLGPIIARPNQIFISAIQPGQTIMRKLSLNFAPKMSESKIVSYNLPVVISEIKQLSHTKSKSLYQLTLKAPLEPGLHKSKLTFHTNNPLYPTLNVPVMLFTQKPLEKQKAPEPSL
jgi:hypothetical protein